MIAAGIARNPSDPHTAAQSGAACRNPRPAATAHSMALSLARPASQAGEREVSMMAELTNISEKEQILQMAISAVCVLVSSVMALEKAANTNASSTARRRRPATPSHPPSNLGPASQTTPSTTWYGMVARSWRRGWWAR